MLKTARREKLRDVVAAQIKRHIAAEDLRPGDRLPTEADLAARFGVSRLSLREATKALEFLGIIESRPGRGLTVGQMDMGRVTEYLGFHPALHRVSRDELIDTRLLIETGVLAHVSRRMREDVSLYESLSAINGGLRRARGVERWVVLDIAFHRGLIECSGLSPLLAFNDLLTAFFQRFRESVRAAHWKAGVESHQKVLDALRLGAVGEAADELRRHIESHREPLRDGP